MKSKELECFRAAERLQALAGAAELQVNQK